VDALGNSISRREDPTEHVQCERKVKRWKEKAIQFTSCSFFLPFLVAANHLKSSYISVALFNKTCFIFPQDLLFSIGVKLDTFILT
jgi:hypothetical protein